MATIRGRCPMGCGETLILGSGGFITCGYLECPQPTAISDILDDPETEHIVEFRDTSFTVRHPLRERVHDAMLDCDLGQYCASLSGPPTRPGRYRAWKHDGGWRFAEVPAIPIGGGS